MRSSFPGPQNSSKAPLRGTIFRNFPHFVFRFVPIFQNPLLHTKNTSHDWVTEPLQVVTTDLMGPISPAALGNSSYLAKFTDVYSRFSVVYFLKNKSSSSVLDSLMKFGRDLAIPFGQESKVFEV